MPIKGKGLMPSKKVLQEIASWSYKAVPHPQIGDFSLISSSPTLKFYKGKDNTIIVGVRGTKPRESEDLKADAAIAIGALESSTRFQNDLKKLLDFQKIYPMSKFDYYGVGHSLGGAIIDLFLKKGLLKKALSYNPAVQPTDLRDTTIANERIYTEGDPLYAVMGQNLAIKPEVRKERPRKWWENVIQNIPIVRDTYNAYTAHQLSQFEGGGIPFKRPYVSHNVAM